jgi:hypothetical protein
MLNRHETANAAPRPQFVSVHYGDGHQSLWLAADATMAELAARIGDMDDDHQGTALLINVRLGARAIPKCPQTTAQ